MKKLLAKLKKLFKSSSKGFTLIELLVVIAILGVLAAGLLQTIDPFEQTKKGRDTVTRNTSIEYLSALTRYYGTHGEFPWDADDDDLCTAPAVPDTTNGPTRLSATNIKPCTTILQDEGELKSGFGEAITNSGADAQIGIRTDGTTGVTVCYSPTAKSFRADAATKYTNDCSTAASSGCPDAKASDNECWQIFK